MVQKPSTRERLEALLKQYGATAAVVYFSLFFLVIAAFAAAIHFGFKPQTATGVSGTLLGAWLAAKATQLPRIAATLALTPIVAKLVERVRGQRAKQP
jgi:hypothetical protein